jgi:release factor glutamine methyltransferase
LAAPRICDVGTGSGNLAIAIAKSHPGTHVTAIDISIDALAVARGNAEKHGVASRITFTLGDLFAPLDNDDRFDFVVSNPPYIPTSLLASLPAGVRDYEPRLALDGGPDGYHVFDRLTTDARRYLNLGGWLIVEIGAPQSGPARQRLTDHGSYEVAATVHDYSGHPRVLKARRV